MVYIGRATEDFQSSKIIISVCSFKSCETALREGSFGSSEIDKKNMDFELMGFFSEVNALNFSEYFTKDTIINNTNFNKF